MGRGLSYNVVLVVFVHLLDVGVHQRLQAVAITGDAELRLASLQGGHRQQDVLDEGEDTVVVDLLGSGLRFADLLLDAVDGFEEVDLAVWWLLVESASIWGRGCVGCYLLHWSSSCHQRDRGPWRCRDARAEKCVSLSSCLSNDYGNAYLLVAKLGVPLGRRGEQLALVKTTELSVHIQVLLVKDLQEGVQETTQGTIVGLLDNLSTGALRIVLRNHGGQSVDVHHVVSVLLVRAAANEAQFFGRDTDGLQQSGNGVFIVFRAVLDDLEGRLQGIQVGVQIGDQNGHLRAGGEELGDLYGGHYRALPLVSCDNWPRLFSGGIRTQVSAVRLSSRASTCRIVKIIMLVVPL